MEDSVGFKLWDFDISNEYVECEEGNGINEVCFKKLNYDQEGICSMKFVPTKSLLGAFQIIGESDIKIMDFFDSSPIFKSKFNPQDTQQEKELKKFTHILLHELMHGYLLGHEDRVNNLMHTMHEQSSSLLPSHKNYLRCLFSKD